MHRDIIWEWADRPGLEHLALDISSDAIVADGLVLVALDGHPTRLRYRVLCDGAWRFRTASVSLDDGGAARRVELARDEDGAWRVDGAPRPDLKACVDIDIMGTPFTNTLPVRRLDLRPDAPQEIRAAWVKVPGLAVVAADQDYTRLDAVRVRYRSLDSGFTATLSLDADGVVVDYGEIWRRRAG